MEAFVIELSSQRMYRELFWHLATIAPPLMVTLLALAMVPRYRRTVAVAVLLAVAGAVAFAVVFHYTYALGTWAGHDSAIRWLDEVAFMAGFTASMIGYAGFLLARTTIAKALRP